MNKILNLSFMPYLRNLLIFVIMLSISFCGKDSDLTINNEKIEKNDIVDVEDYKTTNYIIAVNGLTLRKEPSLESEKLEVIPFGTKIETLKKTINTSKIKSENYYINNYWYYAEYNGIKGWLFGEYISLNKMSKQLVMLDRIIKRPFISYPPIRMLKPDISIYDAIISTFGKPEEILKMDVVNRYDPKQTDQNVNIVYDFAKFNFYKIKNKYMMTSFSIYSNKNKLQNEIDFSMKISDIEKKYGKPSVIRDNKYHYSVPDGPVENDVIFSFKNDVLSEITILYYFD